MNSGPHERFARTGKDGDVGTVYGGEDREGVVHDSIKGGIAVDS
jgi:hypothetical protein